MDAAGHVRQLVRSADGDRYLSVLYAPEDKRRSLFALYAFNVEVASIRDRIREPLAGEVRLTWWRDAVASGTTSVTGNPVADELNATIERYRLPRRVFADMLEARMFDLYDDAMPDRETLEGYCGETAGALIQLAALVLDAEAAQRSAEAAGHGGCAQAITGLLRLLPVHRRRGQCYIPAGILRAAGTSRDEFDSEAPGEGASRVLAATIALAREHLTRFEAAAQTLPKSLRPAFLPVAPTAQYLRAIDDLGPQALAHTADIGPFVRHWSLLRRARAGWR